MGYKVRCFWRLGKEVVGRLGLVWMGCRVFWVVLILFCCWVKEVGVEGVVGLWDGSFEL